MSEKPNKSSYMESTQDGKFAVLVFFTKQELKEMEYYCNNRRISIPKWIVNLVKDELNPYLDEDELDELEKP